MSLTPLLAAPLLVQLHAFAALAALLLGAVQLLGVKGNALHRRLGWAWVLLMATVALTALGITGHAGPGRYSWIHGLVALVGVLLPLAVWQARRGRISGHRNTMLGLFLFALVLTGGLTLLPGRIMHRVVFG
jgi:uncharacterized membrane protein